MKTKILTLLVLLAIAVVSCQKDEADKPAVQQDVEFGIIQVDPNLLKDGTDWNFQCTPGLIPTVAEVVIGATTYWPQVFYLNGNLYTQAIKLSVAAGGTQVYTVNKFVLWTIQPDNVNTPTNGAQIVMATPNAGAPYSQYVSRPVPFNVTVNAFQKTEENIDVLCFIPEVVEGFGFFWFVIDEVIVREQCFFGDLCIKSKGDYVGSYYDDIFELNDYPFDLPAIFKVKLVRNDGWEKEFTNITITGGVASNYQAPLCVKYPDRVGINDQFTATLSILVAQGNGWAFVEFKTWTFTNFMINELVPNMGEVIDFVVGNCNYDPNADPNWVFPAWVNLPQTANINIAQNWDYLYWKLIVNTVNPAATNYDILNPGTWASFCGDGNVEISQGTHNFHIYNTLVYDWVANPMPYANAKLKFEKIHWLINNIGSYGFPAPQGIYITPSDFDVAQAKDIQDAIWYIVRDGATPTNGWASGGAGISALSNTLVTAANTNGAGFKPLPGQWSSVLIIKDDNPRTNQLIFAMIDP